MPPSTTAERMSTEKKKRKLSGLMKLARLANNHPANPAVEAPTAKAHSFIRKLGTPMASAASSSSRMADHARPTRDRPRRTNTKMVRVMATRVR